MENLKEKAEALDKTAQSISKYTMGWLVIIIIIYSYFLYTVARDSAEDANNILFKENEKLTQKSSDCEDENKSIYRELLQKNGIIDKKEQEIKTVDSLSAENLKQKAEPLLKKIKKYTK